ncbi:hypothetical protein SAMN02746065_11623 [Desulfocicer vacuolatum DSM 3385]|uniref:NGG1p interacting factor NIF3 n=1 Tax=Desulfocicer vacuolatum DSM 3385 TaxID=1121400 RepID=A0A1W2D9X1_9BACT|nr:NGG1p interacting factor NIF3 [Desulfocicer vacuolatum]SMC93902.1 hypothetical protein SAMN02746065_11623 [Desulfocicer vacuolatum DSM 3385]
MYLISFYVPPDHLETVKNALFKKGAGKIGHYDACAWHTMGQGQFRPLAGSQPFKGEENIIEQCEEARVEMVCEDHILKTVLQELVRVHPYETPAYHAIQGVTLENL